MRRIALDIGQVRVGVAVSDGTGTVATPLTVWDAGELAVNPSRLQQLISEYEASEVVVGLPKMMDGSEGPQSRSVREYAGRLARAVAVPFVFYDERLTSVEAERAMGEAGLDSRNRRGRVDMVAATILLQSYLDSQRERGEGE